jgi:hypothetical protein
MYFCINQPDYVCILFTIFFCCIFLSILFCFIFLSIFFCLLPVLVMLTCHFPHPICSSIWCSSRFSRKTQRSNCLVFFFFFFFFFYFFLFIYFFFFFFDFFFFFFLNLSSYYCNYYFCYFYYYSTFILFSGSASMTCGSVLSSTEWRQSSNFLVCKRERECV